MKTPGFFYLLVLIVFLLANPAMLLPQTWGYLQAYTSGELLKHSGYLMGDTLYKNNMPSTPFWGTPIYFYLFFMAIKVPIPIIIAFVSGLVVCIKNWRKPGPGFLLLMFLLWIVPYSLIGAKWLRFTLALMPIVYMMAAVGITSLLKWIVSSYQGSGARQVNALAYATVLVVFVALPGWTAYANGPHYALYTNVIGGDSAAGFYFPHDEYYDDGLREAIRFVCGTAPSGATIVNEAPGVVRYYLKKYGREDLQSRVLSNPNFNIDAQEETFIILQQGRTYFENINKIRDVRQRFKPVFALCPRYGRAAAVVYSTKSGQTLLNVCDNINL